MRWYCHIYEFTGFVHMVFHHYIRLVGCYFYICVYLHSTKHRSFFIFSDRRWFMFIAHLQHLDVVVLTRFPIDLIGVISGFNT